MADKETWSYWDHITGECFQGTHNGKRLESWPIALTTAGAALAEFPEITASLSGFRGIVAGFLSWTTRNAINSRGFIPPFMRGTMADPIDGRLHKLTQGLGVIDANDHGKFYAMRDLAKGSFIEDQFSNRPLRIHRRASDGVLHAVWIDNDEIPMQLMSRWYGFSFTYPGCEVYSPGDS
jgi:hypothetical protein